MAWLAAMAWCAAVATPARAQENYEIEVYPSATVAPKTLVLELHSNFTARGETLYVDGVAPSHHAWHETVEATVGLTDWMELGGYVFTDAQAGLGANVVGGSFRPRVRVPDRWGWPVGVSLSSEIEYARPLFSEETWSWEIRPIVDTYRGRWYVSLNPTVERVLQSTTSRTSVRFVPSAKWTYDVTQQISAGLEYYASAGEGAGSTGFFDVDTATVPPGGRGGGPNLARAVDTDELLHIPNGARQQLFAAVDLHLSPLWEINLGVGVGTTASTDHLMAKLILGRSFSWASLSPTQ